MSSEPFDGGGGGGGTSGRFERAMTYLDKSEQFGTLGQTVMTVFGGIIVFIGSAFVMFGDAVVTVWIMFLEAFGIGGQSWIFAFTRDPAGFISASFQQAGTSMQEGAWAELGPFLPWIATIVAIGVVWMVSVYLDKRDSDVPGTGLDIPGIGNEGTEEEEEGF